MSSVFLESQSKTEKSFFIMLDDVVQDVRAHVESVVSAKMGELEERLSKLLSGCATEASVRAESDTLKVLLAGIETRFLEDHEALVDAINAHTAATTAQTALLGALCGDVKAMDEKLDVLCSHTGRLGHIEGDVAAISKSVQGVAKGPDAVSSFVTRLNEFLEDIRLVVEHSASEIRKAEEEKRKAEEAARQKEERERDAKRKAEEAMSSSFSGNELETRPWDIVSTPSSSGRGNRVRRSSSTAPLMSSLPSAFSTKSKTRRTSRSLGSRRTAMSSVGSTVVQ